MQLARRVAGALARPIMRRLRSCALSELRVLAQRVDDDGRPRLNPISTELQDLAALRWNIKTIGAALVRDLYEAGKAGPQAPIPEEPIRAGLTGGLCRQADIESNWLRYWCGQIHWQPLYHRKLWELGFVLQALWEAGMLTAGKSGLGFAVGRESLPSYFASKGVRVVATDLPGNDDRSAGWQSTGQHSSELGQLYFDYLVEREKFDALCSFRPVDMNDIPADLHGQFDFCWSSCSFEHTGSIALGLAFVRNAMKCLKPGGIAVHTTEFNLGSDRETMDNWSTVLFQRRHFDALSTELAAHGYHMMPINYDPGADILDMFVDTPPFPHEPHPMLKYPDCPHLRLNVNGFPATSIGIIVRA